MLIDLDELVSECPDPRSRKYIREAVQCYKAGAYRSAVVSCWIAVAFDLVDKIRELAASGDAMAQEAISKFDRARQDGDVRAALTFEKDLLTVARDRFEFISPIEYIDLERLVDDRNRCAHPSHVSDMEVFEASPELARLHIVNATRYVLSQPAAQGKQALDRLQTELDSNFFPAKRKDMVVFLRAGPLAKPRESLIRNYLSILLKRLLKEVGADFERRLRATNALFAVAELHPEPWKRLVRELLGNVIDDLLKEETLPLYASALSRVRHATAEELLNQMWFDTPAPVIDRLIVLYRTVNSFAEANEFAKRLRYPLMDSVQPEKHLSQMIQVAVKNNQVRHSNQYPVLLQEFADNKSIERERVKQLLRDAGIEDIVDQL